MNHQRKLDEKCIPMFRILGCMNFVFSLLLLLIAWFLFNKYEWNEWWLFVLAIATIGYSLYRIFIYPNRMYSIFRYEVFENKIDLQSGIFVVTKTVIPMFRVQHVQTMQGPLLKKFGLSKLIIYTAGSVYEIPALSENIAEELREKIVLLTKGIE